MREIRTHGSIGRGPETAHGDDYSGTKPETADTDKSEPTGYRAGLRPYRGRACPRGCKWPSSARSNGRGASGRGGCWRRPAARLHYRRRRRPPPDTRDPRPRRRRTLSEDAASARQLRRGVGCHGGAAPLESTIPDPSSFLLGDLTPIRDPDSRFKDSPRQSRKNSSPGLVRAHHLHDNAPLQPHCRLGRPTPFVIWKRNQT